MEAAVIRFTTALFDVSKERPNSIRPIFRESLLLWLTDKLRGRVALTSPDKKVSVQSSPRVAVHRQARERRVRRGWLS
jgi:hypothetical protein